MIEYLCMYKKYVISKGASNQLSQDSRHRLTIDDIGRPYFSKIKNSKLKKII